MNNADWQTATGSAFVGMDGGFARRPMNPRLFAAALGRTVPPSRAQASQARTIRRLVYEVAKLRAASSPPVVVKRNAAARRAAYQSALLSTDPADMPPSPYKYGWPAMKTPKPVKLVRRYPLVLTA